MLFSTWNLYRIADTNVHYKIANVDAGQVPLKREGPKTHYFPQLNVCDFVEEKFQWGSANHSTLGSISDQRLSFPRFFFDVFFPMSCRATACAKLKRKIWGRSPLRAWAWKRILHSTGPRWFWWKLPLNTMGWVPSGNMAGFEILCKMEATWMKHC